MVVVSANPVQAQTWVLATIPDTPTDIHPPNYCSVASGILAFLNSNPNDYAYIAALHDSTINCDQNQLSPIPTSNFIAALSELEYFDRYDHTWHRCYSTSYHDVNAAGQAYAFAAGPALWCSQLGVLRPHRLHGEYRVSYGGTPDYETYHSPAWDPS